MHLLRRLSRLDVLRLGFGGMIALLIFSAGQAYRIQRSSEQHSAEIYHRYVQKGAALSHIRRMIFLGSIYTRDLFLSARPDRANIFRSQIAQLNADAKKEFDELARLSGPDPSTAELRTQLEGLWTKLESVLNWVDTASLARAYDFVQNEIVPRRNAAAEAVNMYTEVNQRELTKSEAEFDANRQAAARRLLTILAFSLALGLVVAWFSIRHASDLERQAVRRLEEVMRARKELQLLSARLLETEEAARTQLSHELHDEIGQSLHALRIEISQALAAWKEGEPAAEARLNQARALAERTVESVRNITLLLRPPMLDDLGLGPALQWLAEDFSRRSGIRSSLADDGLPENLPDTHKTCVYRVVQEALHNCEKHSGAAAVSIVAGRRNGRLEVEIVDDGRGFQADPGGPPGGLGILGMRERAATLEGTISVDSAPSRGTRLKLSLPMPAATGEPVAHQAELPA